MGTEGKNYQLNCLIQGRKDTLAFLIPYDAEIKELKQVIYRLGELEGRLRDLALWKVDIELNPLQGLIELKIEDIQGIQEFLSVSSQPLSDLWQEQPSLKHLHVFAMVHDKGEKPATSLPSQETKLNEQLRKKLDQYGEQVDQIGKQVEHIGKQLNQLRKQNEQFERQFEELGCRLDSISKIRHCFIAPDSTS